MKICQQFLLSCLLAGLAWATPLTGMVTTGVNPQSMTRWGSPLEGVEIEIQGSEFRTTSRANGTFLFPDLPDGRYTLKCHKEGYGDARLTISVPGGGVSVVMNPPDLSPLGDFMVPHGAVYVAYLKRPLNENNIESSPYSLVAQKAMAAGVRIVELWSNQLQLPKMPQGSGQAHLMNDVIGDENFVMSFAPRTPARTAFLKQPVGGHWLCFSRDGATLFQSQPGDCLAVLNARHEHELIRNIALPGAVCDLQLGSDPEILVVSHLGAGVTLVNTTTGLPQCQVKAPPGLHSAALVSNRLFMVCGDSRQGQLVCQDITTGARLGDCRLGTNPTHVVATPDGSRVVVANAGAASISLVDTLQVREIARIPVGVEPQRLALSPDGKRCFVANKQSGTVSVIDLELQGVMATVPVGREPLGLAFSRDGGECYVACRRDGCLMVLNGSTGALQHTTIPMPNAIPYGVAVRP